MYNTFFYNGSWQQALSFTNLNLNLIKMKIGILHVWRIISAMQGIIFVWIWLPEAQECPIYLPVLIYLSERNHSGYSPIVADYRPLHWPWWRYCWGSGLVSRGSKCRKNPRDHRPGADPPSHQGRKSYSLRCTIGMLPKLRKPQIGFTLPRWCLHQFMLALPWN